MFQRSRRRPREGWWRCPQRRQGSWCPGPTPTRNKSRRNPASIGLWFRPNQIQFSGFCGSIKFLQAGTNKSKRCVHWSEVHKSVWMVLNHWAKSRHHSRGRLLQQQLSNHSIQIKSSKKQVLNSDEAIKSKFNWSNPFNNEASQDPTSLSLCPRGPSPDTPLLYQPHPLLEVRCSGV